MKIHSFYISKQLPSCITSFELHNEIHTVTEQPFLTYLVKHLWRIGDDDSEGFVKQSQRE